ncbi:unnamed protein product [Ascophyllum nodosum]
MRLLEIGSARFYSGLLYLEDQWPCAGGLSAVNAIGTRNLRYPINSGLTQWRMAVQMDTVVESGRKEKSPSASTSFSLGVTNGGLKQYGRAEPLSRDQTLRRKREQGGKKSLIS